MNKASNNLLTIYSPIIHRVIEKLTIHNIYIFLFYIYNKNINSEKMIYKF